MIRKLQQSDIDPVVRIWLEASTQAHDFVGSEFWKSKVNDMRQRYLPSAETYVYEEEQIKGFVCLCGETLAALFVLPKFQGMGIGRRLMEKAKECRKNLSLTVYTENTKGVAFYQKCGFEIEREQVDPQTGHPEWVMKYTTG